MAKLSLSVQGGNDGSEQSGAQQTSKLSLTKKVVHEESQEGAGSVSASLSQKFETEKVAADPIVQSQAVSSWLVEKFGSEVFDELINNPNLQMPYTEENLSTEKWLERVIKTLFSQETILKISSKLSSQSVDSGEIDKIVAEKLSEKTSKYNDKFQQMRSQMEEIEGEKAAVEAQLNKAIPLKKFIDVNFKNPDGETEAQKRIRQTINEAAEQSRDETVSVFVMKFAKGFSALNYVLNRTTEGSEKDRLEIVYPALTDLLTCVSGCYISERRTLLDLVAKHCNEFFTEYDFISPEQTLNVDPDIHNASGAGNGSIKEGSSFAVVRRDTKKTVKYADIKL
ncbi:MAG: hypothetical protein II956_10325 [Bacteroidales bacterium]|nr:hypothetical protein [Bacteroidales bacterium]